MPESLQLKSDMPSVDEAKLVSFERLQTNCVALEQAIGNSLHSSCFIITLFIVCHSCIKKI